jgi:serine/threonine-protein kinase
MRGEPSPNLVSLLARLKLASIEDLRGVASRVRRLAGDLPDFESVWVDALAGARILTPFQAAEINASRGDELLNGPYSISRPLPGPHYAACFAARHVDSCRSVRLYVVARPQSGTAAIVRALAELVEQSKPLGGPASCVVEGAGTCGESVWAACAAVQGVAASDWMVENGRFPPQVVLHIAREMLTRLTDVERLGITHGDLGAGGLLLQASGHVVLPMAGLRGVVRPSEGYGFSELQPEGYDYLAPERISDGGPPTVAGDVYACGCLWWHLLTGRPPFSGGNSLAKLKAVHAAKVIDVRQLAPEVPDILARAIAACLQREPAARPRTVEQLAALLGPPTRAGKALIGSTLNRQPQLWHRAAGTRTRKGAKSARVKVGAVLAVALVLAMIGSWPLWRAGSRLEPTTGPLSTRRSTALAEKKAVRPKVAADRAIAVEPRAGQKSPVTLAAATSKVAPSAADDMILSSDEKLRLVELDLKPGRRVRGQGGKRPVVCVPPQGLAVACNDIRFDGIDFVWEAEQAVARKANRTAAMIKVEAQAIEFHGCSFSTTADSPPVAIAWTGAADNAPLAASEIVLGDCVFSGVAAVIDRRGAGGFSVEMSNSLCLASGPIVRLHRATKVAESITISLERTTTRGDSSVLECRYERLEANSGSITISATDSVFGGNPHGGLLILSGSQHPRSMLGAITWNGQGSLVTPESAVVLWRNGSGSTQELPEDEMEVAGLVRSSIDFVGPAQGPPGASRITRWQGPLRSADPPGANVSLLSLPAK